MTLASILESAFKPTVRFRGANYFRERRVEIERHSPAEVYAVVYGGQIYRVKISVTDYSFRAACTCVYFIDVGACKHLWATILEIDRNQYLAAALEQEPRGLELDFSTARALLSEGLAVNESGNGNVQKRSEGESEWQQQLRLVRTSTDKAKVQEGWPASRQITYLIDTAESDRTGQITIDIGYRERTTKGEWSKFKPKRIPIPTIPTISEATDSQILGLLSGAKEHFYQYSYSFNSLSSRCYIPAEANTVLLPLLCSTNRCFFRVQNGVGGEAIRWDHNARWELSLQVRSKESQNSYEVLATLHTAAEDLPLTSVAFIGGGVLITRDGRAGKLVTRDARAWMSMLNKRGSVNVPLEQANEFLDQLLSLNHVPRLVLPPELQYETVQGNPTPFLRVRRPDHLLPAYRAAKNELEADLLFNYEGQLINYFDARASVYHRGPKRLLTRDVVYEAAAVELLATLGVKDRRVEYELDPKFVLTAKRLPQVVKTLLANAWKVEAEGKLYRKASSASLSVSSGVDWFELHGEVQYGDGLVAKLPELLRALKRGESMVQLSDGEFGLLPEEWLEKHGLLVSLGEPNTDHLRFQRAQTGLLDVLLATQPEVKVDEVFARVISEWRNFKGITPLTAPQSFVGTLRHYQTEALGWFQFLERFQFGGCLADDMGLGKTVQVLALLESRRITREKAAKRKRAKTAAGTAEPRRPSLVVVPRSLVFNWQQEAERFTPRLRILIHSGIDRRRGITHFDDYDVVLTTYGTLRRDAIDFQAAEFDYVILDESQAIKNAKTESAKAVSLLKANNRLALSGTPIENHIGELWSLFEFLNPGMLGSASVFQSAFTAGRSANIETRQALSRAVRPFFLRRTKEQVAKELPEKIEQTIYCEMDTVQRRQYDELRDHYRESLLSRVEQVGMGRAKIQILEALLRLRQTACHPALLTKREEDGPNAKLDVLLPRVTEIVAEGHKALVFSQFTSFLSIVRHRLEKERIVCEYLDGKTRDREARVTRFQNDVSCKVFLISLKAGGQGLNLTAADYVFLLDPWWNPAVEAQAIDRAHRIGQSKRVFACRLITRDTVEEKVLELQKTKRHLADAIINEDNSLIKTITGDELLLLLS